MFSLYFSVGQDPLNGPMKTAPGSREPIDILSILQAVVCVLAILSMGLGVVENRRLSNLGKEIYQTFFFNLFLPL